LPAGGPRLPLRPLNKDEKRELDQVIDRMNATLAQIDAGAHGGASRAVS